MSGVQSLLGEQEKRLLVEENLEEFIKALTERELSDLEALVEFKNTEKPS